MSSHHEKKYSELEKRNSEAEIGGGKARIKAQHMKGKQTARERIDVLLDSESFQETDKFVKHRTNEFGLENKKFLDRKSVV